MKNSTAGFTLIELLVVIATISVLIGLLIPGGVSKAREAAEKANQTTKVPCYSCRQ